MTVAGTILRVRTTGCMRTRQSSYEIVRDCSDKDDNRYQPLQRLILQEILARRRAMFMLRVMTHVVSYKRFWNWIGPVSWNFQLQVASHWVRSDNCYEVDIFIVFFGFFLLFWWLSIWIRIIFNVNTSVNKTRFWNQMPYRQLEDFFRAQARYFCEQNSPQAKIYV